MKDIGTENTVSTATRAVCQLVNKGKTAATSVCLKKSGAGIFEMNLNFLLLPILTAKAPERRIGFFQSLRLM